MFSVQLIQGELIKRGLKFLERTDESLYEAYELCTEPMGQWGRHFLISLESDRICVGPYDLDDDFTDESVDLEYEQLCQPGFDPIEWVLKVLAEFN